MRKEYELKIIDRKEEATNAVTLTLEVPSNLKETFKFEAGQFIGITSKISGEEVHRSYSLSSDPLEETTLKISIKKIHDGRMSTHLVDKVKCGDFLRVTPPTGHFFKSSDTKRHHIMFAAGSGVTPLISIIYHLKSTRPNEQMSLFYWNQDLKSTMFLPELEKWNLDENIKLNTFLSFTKENVTHPLTCFSERANPSNLKECFYKWSVTLDSPVFYLCGPEEFMKTIEEFLGLKGYDSLQIRKESFYSSSSEPTQNTTDSSEDRFIYIGNLSEKNESLQDAICEARLDGDNISVTPEEDETILEAFLRIGEQPPYSCFEGTCMACQCKVTSGLVSMPKDTFLSKEEIDDGIILSCKGVVKSKNVRVDFDDV